MSLRFFRRTAHIQQDLPYLFKTGTSFGVSCFAFLKASRGSSKYSLNSGFLLSKAKSSLENAKKDGHHCFKSKNNRRDMTMLAETCQKLAKFPSISDYGSEFVKTEHYLHEALDYLFYATHSGDPIDYHWTNRISSCLFDLGEYEKAIEWFCFFRIVFYYYISNIKANVHSGCISKPIPIRININ
jgi:hypothetical protein